MPKPTKGPRLGGSPAHERIILANLATQLFEHGRITTTETRAKRMQPLAEKLITKAKRGDLHSRRIVMKTIKDPTVVHVLFAEIAPALEGRDGGCTRITKVGNRKGDNAAMAIIEVITEEVVKKPPRKKAEAKKTEPAATLTVDSDADEVVDEVDADEVEEAEEDIEEAAEDAADAAEETADEVEDTEEAEEDVAEAVSDDADEVTDN